ncbi:putative BRCT domain protein [Vibrio phage 393E50-1]|nr:putative BRCT domain protein [Vibrio phage 393E50-1]
MKHICLTGFKVSKLLTDRMSRIGIATNYGLNDDTELMVVGETPTLSILSQAIARGVPMITAEQFEDTTLPALEREHCGVKFNVSALDFGKPIAKVISVVDFGDGLIVELGAVEEEPQPCVTLESFTEQVMELYREGLIEEVEIGHDLFVDNYVTFDGMKVSYRNLKAMQTVFKKLSDTPADKKLSEQLADAVKSERHYMSVLKEIGRIFGKNVGVDIGVDDLAQFIGDEVNVNIPHHFNSVNKPNSDAVTKLNTYLSKSKYAAGNVGQCVADVAIENLEAYRELGNDLVTSLGLTYTNESYIDADLIKMVGDLHRKVNGPSIGLVQQIKQHPELHDLITHLHDFKTGVELRELVSRTNSTDDADRTYWAKQLDVINKLINLTK